MSIIAAFLWNGSNDKSISYMIIDDNYLVRHNPVITKLHSRDLNSFKHDANEIIQTFFAEIKHISQAKKNSNITIEYKIVSHAAPVNQYDVKIQKPSDRTEFVRDKFNEYYNRASTCNGSLQLASQYRKKLIKPYLDEFKNHLNELHIVNKEKNNAYKYHLWALALHATKSNYEKKLKKLTITIRQAQVELKDEKKRHAA